MGIYDSFRNIGHNLRNLTKSYTETTSRPAIMQPYMATDTGAKLPIFPYPLIMLYELADNVDALRIPIETLNREMFKNGFEVTEKFKYKCNNCEKEFQYKPIKSIGVEGLPDTPSSTSELGKADTNNDGISESDNGDDQKDPDKDGFKQKEPDKDGLKHKEIDVLECDECGSRDLRRPKPENRKVLERLYEKFINNNDQTIMEVLRQLERDLEIADNAYMLLLKNYKIDDETGEINEEGTEIKEILRIDPPQVAMIADSDGRVGFDDKRIPVYVCPHFEHRDRRLTSEFCTRIGKEHSIPVRSLRAVAEVSSVYSIGIPQPKRVIYAEGEIIWKAGKYKPGLIYGFSPIYAMWSKVMALSHMDEYIRKFFDKMRPPRGLLVIASRNYETFKKAWDQLEDRAQEDPYNIHPMMVESEKGGRNIAQWIDFTGSLKELQFIDIRRELRMIIGAIYGVLPLYFGELPSGWSQEGMQVTITNRAVKWGQEVLHDSFLARLSKILRVDDWTLKLKTGEEIDKLRDLQIESQEIANMKELQSMGFPVERTHQGQWKVGKIPTFAQNPITGTGRDRGAGAPKEQQSDFEGQPMKRRPSDLGGQHQGSVASGPKTSLSAKAYESLGYLVNNPKGHSYDFWENKLLQKGFSTYEIEEVISTWFKEEKKSGTLYMPLNPDRDHPGQKEKPHLIEGTHENTEIEPTGNRDGDK